MALFGSKKEVNSFLGIDISSDAIKVVELKNFQGKPQLSTYGYTQARADVLKGSFIENINLTATLLKEVLNKAKCESTKAMAAIPVSKTFTYVLKIQKILKKDLSNVAKVKSILAGEVKKVLPMPIEEMQFDFTVINGESYKGLKDTDEINDVKFLITAASNAIVKKYTEIFQQAGLELLNLDIESFALVRSMVGNDKSLVMMVDFGDNTTSLSIVDDGVPIFNRSVDIGGSAITRKLAETMQISLEEAEQYKLDLGILMQQQQMTELPKPVELVIAPIVSEIKFLIKTYYEQISNQKQLDRIILTGGSSTLAGLQEHITKKLDIRTYVGDPWARIIYPQELASVLREVGPRFSVAIGLAMTKIK